ATPLRPHNKLCQLQTPLAPPSPFQTTALRTQLYAQTPQKSPEKALEATQTEKPCQSYPDRQHAL
ncbi:MAG: hypothetical protein ACOYMW_14325, partial [Candidatus Competibacteraceae bacterium]